jgi:hypothetical protein
MPRNKRIAHISGIDNSVEQLQVSPANTHERGTGNDLARTGN